MVHALQHDQPASVVDDRDDAAPVIPAPTREIRTMINIMMVNIATMILTQCSSVPDDDRFRNRAVWQGALQRI
jgi:hypothetical protein